MKVYLAGLDSPGTLGKLGDRIAQCRYILMSYAYLPNNKLAVEVMKEWESKGNFMLDSGAYTFISQNNKPSRKEIYDFTKRYIEFIVKHGINIFLEMDLDPFIPQDEVLSLRQMIAEGTGKNPVLSWHIERGDREFIRMCRENDFACYGGFGMGRSGRAALRRYAAEANRHNCRLHALGVTRGKLEGLGFWSVDSSSVTGGVRYGKIQKFEDGQIKNTLNTSRYMMDGTKLLLHNYGEWIKFQRYMEDRF